MDRKENKLSMVCFPFLPIPSLAYLRGECGQRVFVSVYLAVRRVGHLGEKFSKLAHIPEPDRKSVDVEQF